MLDSSGGFKLKGVMSWEKIQEAVKLSSSALIRNLSHRQKPSIFRGYPAFLT